MALAWTSTTAWPSRLQSVASTLGAGREGRLCLLDHLVDGAETSVSAWTANRVIIDTLAGQQLLMIGHTLARNAIVAATAAAHAALGPPAVARAARQHGRKPMQPTLLHVPGATSRLARRSAARRARSRMPTAARGTLDTTAQARTPGRAE